MRNIETLREHLFDALDGLKADTVDVAKARAMADIAGRIIESAKVECEHMKLTHGAGSGFIPEKQIPQTPGQPRLVKGTAMSGSR